MTGGRPRELLQGYRGSRFREVAMKKITAIILCLLTLATALAGCGTAEKTNDKDQIKVVATIFPIYDWVLNVAGDDVDINVDLLLDNGVDLHSYQPSAKDIMDISECDVFIYVGGESDKWVDDTLTQANNKDMKVLDLLDILGAEAKEEETIEGMQGETEENAEEEEEAEYDEHVWLSLRNTMTFVSKIADALAEKDAQHADAFKSNAASYLDKLTSLDKSYTEAVDSASVKTLLFGDRFPFRYLVDDYGLRYYAAFAGCSAETEASFETILFLSDKVDELGLRAILKTESSDGAIADTIRANTATEDQQILTLNAMQSVTAADIAAGESYLNIMTENLAVLEQALA